MKKFSIGEMAKICNVSIQTLRYYDKINLIKPAQRNPENNYRYYLIQQVFQINIIKYLQYAGLSIEEIRRAINLKGDLLANFLTDQSHNIDNQIQQLRNSQRLINGQITQLHELKSITQYPLETVYQRYINEQNIIQIPTQQIITPLDYPDKETSELDKILIKNKTIGNLQYGFSFPLKNYQSLEDIHYQEILTQVFTDSNPKLKQDIKKIPEGNYLCISFYWDRSKYFGYYQKLQQEFNQQYPNASGTVYEISSVDYYGYHDENDFINELRIKLPEK
ncbi:MerR family transcriptional regulator [Companilactobacillus sp. HBUAS59699]|uniref:MerR family transcriptional regulator n=1 Tax=Companilactobacillus sp. HBUAS59699 TaxID=3109358 RepID=UPI002FF36148